MNENQDHKNPRRNQRKFSLEDKRNYCIAWEKSGLNQGDFCKENGISTSALYQWNKTFKKENQGIGFSPLALARPSSIKKQVDMVQLSVCFPNQIQLSLNMPEHRLVSFIQELGYAITVIR